MVMAVEQIVLPGHSLLCSRSRLFGQIVLSLWYQFLYRSVKMGDEPMVMEIAYYGRMLNGIVV